MATEKIKTKVLRGVFGANPDDPEGMFHVKYHFIGWVELPAVPRCGDRFAYMGYKLWVKNVQWNFDMARKFSHITICI